MEHAPAFLALVEEVRPRIREVDTNTVKRMHDALENVLIVDVREDSEWQAGRIPGAIHLGRGVIERDIEQAVPDKAAHLVLYCGGGFRSALAAENLQKMGYTKVYSMAGGWREWCEKNYPIQYSPNSI